MSKAASSCGLERTRDPSPALANIIRELAAKSISDSEMQTASYSSGLVVNREEIDECLLGRLDLLELVLLRNR